MPLPLGCLTSVHTCPIFVRKDGYAKQFSTLCIALTSASPLFWLECMEATTQEAQKAEAAAAKAREEVPLFGMRTAWRNEESGEAMRQKKT